MRCHGQCVPSSAKQLCILIVYIMGMWSMLAEKKFIEMHNGENIRVLTKGLACK